MGGTYAGHMQGHMQMGQGTDTGGIRLEKHLAVN